MMLGGYATISSVEAESIVPLKKEITADYFLLLL